MKIDKSLIGRSNGKDPKIVSIDANAQDATYTYAQPNHRLKAVEKGWAYGDGSIGEIFIYHEPDEEVTLNVGTVKLLRIGKGKKLSRHFHCDKNEYFYLLKGKILVETWNENSEHHSFEMVPHQRYLMEKGMQHRMVGLEEESDLLEVSTTDKAKDSFRIEKGD